MIKAHFDFINDVSALVCLYSQFPPEVCDWIGCQFALESSFGESSLAHAKKNYCGMKNPMVRISSAIHAGDCYYHWAQYVSLDFCVIDYLLCIQFHCPITTNYDSITHYSKFISKFYCLENDYIDKINLIYQQFKLLKNEYSK